MKELLDLYDANGNNTGKTIYRGEPFDASYYVYIVHLCLFNSRQQMLVQRRSLNKRGNPGLWDITASGFVSSGETASDAIARELKEELGISLAINESNRYFTLKDEGSFHGFFFMKADIDLNDVTLQKEEVMDCDYLSLQQIEQMIEQQTFIPYGFIDLLKQCQKILFPQ